LQNEQGDGYNKSWASWIKSVETPDPLTVKITFARPACRPDALLAFKIVPRHKFSSEIPQRKSDFSFAPVGSGPFALSKITGEEEIVLKRNEQFRMRAEGKPLLSEVDLKRYYDRVTAFTDFTRGDLELLTQLEPLQVDQLRKLGENKFVVKSHETRTVYFLAMNFRRKIFQEPDMRKAIISAIDRHKIIAQYFRGEQGGQAHRVISGPFPAGSWAYNDGKNPSISVPDYPFSPELAKNLVEGLKNRGLGTLLDLSLKFPADDLKVERACVEMRNQLNDAGIRVRAEKRMENNLHDEIYGNGDFDLVYTSYSFDDTMDVSPLFDFEQIGPYRANFCAYKNPELNALFAEMKSSPDPLKIKDLSWQIHSAVARDLAIIPLWQLDNYVAFKATVQGVKVHPYYLFGSPEEWHIAEE
jgi:peptide/nickel transport system substrate-binding protein